MDDPDKVVGEAIEEALTTGRDARISEIFYFFEAVTSLASGRTVGRKIGVVQEILIKKYLEADEGLARRMYLEQMLQGESGAGHKVEFSWFAITPHNDLAVGDAGMRGLKVVEIDTVGEKVALMGDWDGRPVRVALGQPTPRSGPLRAYLDARDTDLRLVDIADGRVSIDEVDRTRLLASLESKRVGAQRFSGTDKLGSGIQTIEKAKQASLVAIDLDIGHNRNVKPLQGPGVGKTLLSLVALGNGVHWTDKDKAVLGTYVDFTFLVRDAGIIRYAEYVRDLVGEEDFLEGFMDYFKGMTKQEPDDFEVFDGDFTIIAPAKETRTLRQVLAHHVDTMNPV